jgi:hypothetical protein
MAISKKLSLDNGVEMKYHIISLITTEYNKDITVEVVSFISKDYYLKAIEQNNLIIEKDKIDKEIKEAFDIDDLDKALQLQDESNNLFIRIGELQPFDTYIIQTNILHIPYKDGFTLEYIENELVKDGLFKNGKIVK